MIETRDGRAQNAVRPSFRAGGAVSVVLIGGVGSCGRLPRCFELVGAVSVVLVGGVDRCGRLPPRWWRQLQSSLLTVLAAAGVVVVVLVGGIGSCSCGRPPHQWQRQLQLVSWSSSSITTSDRPMPGYLWPDMGKKGWCRLQTCD